MKVSNKNLDRFIGFLILCSVMGTLCWRLVEVVLNLGGIGFSLTAGPVGFDIGVMSLYLSINPGTPLGFAGGWLLFKRI